MRVYLIILAIGLVSCKSTKKRGTSDTHIIYLIGDDLGWNDVSWHDDTVYMPTLDAMAKEGVILQNFYVMSACSPSRSALLTGRYSSNIGSQHFVYAGDRPHGVPTYVDMLPEKLKESGYQTVGIGKWHLGFCNISYIPTSRGFDHWYGYWTGAEDYYTHETSEFGPESIGNYNGVDFHDDMESIDGDGVKGVFTSELFQARALETIDNFDVSQGPLFMYLAFQLPHSPKEVPQKWFDAVDESITYDDRRTYLGQIAYLDYIVSLVVQHLKDKDMYDDCLFIFHADNGGHTQNGASNMPYRGNKATYFEGGIKSTGFLYGKGITKGGYTHEGLFHAIDIYPTLVESVAGGTVAADIDGMNIWDALATGADSPRDHFLIVVDTDLADESVPILFRANISAVRKGDWKLMVGHPGFSMLTKDFAWYPTKQLTGDAILETENPDSTDTQLWLFNLATDPYETTNVADDNPDKIAELQVLIDEYAKTAWTFWPDSDPKCDPALYDGFWSTDWC